LPEEAAQILSAVRTKAAFVEEDRPLENDLRWMLEQILGKAWKCYE
jgi:hypothetical protein